MTKKIELKSKDIIQKLDLVFSTEEARKLLKKYWSDINSASGIPSTGFCYIASEVLFHALGGRAVGLKVLNQKIEIGTHWWIEHNENIYDPTAKQLPVGFRYEGKGGNFLTSKPSKRAVRLAEIAGIKLNF